MFTTRREQVLRLVQAAQLNGLVIVPGPNLLYLTGLSFHLSERPIVLLLMADGRAGLALPQLEAGKAEKLPFAAQLFVYDDVSGPATAFAQLRTAFGLGGARIGVEGRTIRFLELTLLGDIRPENCNPLMAELRMRKDAAEIAAMRAATQIAEQAFSDLLLQIRVGMTEKEVAAELMLQLFRHGSEALPFTPIVASGPNGANPHAFPTERALTAGDLVTIDWGASKDHYLADITRTVAIAEPPTAQMTHAHQAVLAGNRAGVAACRPGATCAQVDRETRLMIEAAGLGEYFVHRTGHGLGIEGHEEPDIKAGVHLALDVGMTFTVEPGVYIPGVSGVRIEDDIVITADGCESLTTLPRELQVVGG